MSARQRQENRSAVLEILQGELHADGVVRVCRRSNAVRAVILELIQGSEQFVDDQDNNGDESPRDREVRWLQGRYRETNFPPVESLNGGQLNCLDFLKGNPIFQEEFRAFLPSAVVSSTESTPERKALESIHPRQQTRRDQAQAKENMEKSFARNVGDSLPDSPPGTSREVEDEAE